ncbi:germin-like protein subfamily 1 member 13 [Jatropha curcas]|uniref:germin-like protein subfamily 1 member 13 n=1 Tax=Jatropha curcas TaxID=180498 RepID=UPI001893362C|nr:germin-like protein subfamily 1 member 13 [Jatropha curcas]
MKMANLLIALGVLAMASSFAIAYDPSPLQDLCVATEDYSSGVLVNGKFCKDPEHVTADDFSFSGLNNARETSKQLGIRTNLLTVEEIPGLNTNGLSIVRIDYSPGGVNPPHNHPRAAEIITVLEGTIYAGFITSNPDHRLFAKILKPGDTVDVFVFPFGLIHFQFNIGRSPAVAIAALSSQNPGVVTSANTIFGAVPSLNLQLLARAYHLDKNIVANLTKQEWVNPSDLNSYSSYY